MVASRVGLAETAIASMARKMSLNCMFEPNLFWLKFELWVVCCEFEYTCCSNKKQNITSIYTTEPRQATVARLLQDLKHIRVTGMELSSKQGTAIY